PGPNASPAPPGAPPPAPPTPGAEPELDRNGQLPPGAPTPTNNCSPGATGTVAVTDAPIPPGAGTPCGPHAPPAAPTAITRLLLTPAGTVNEWLPAESNVVVAVVSAHADAPPPHNPQTATTAPAHTDNRPDNRATITHTPSVDSPKHKAVPRGG